MDVSCIHGLLNKKKHITTKTTFSCLAEIHGLLNMELLSLKQTKKKAADRVVQFTCATFNQVSQKFGIKNVKTKASNLRVLQPFSR